MGKNLLKMETKLEAISTALDRMVGMYSIHTGIPVDSQPSLMNKFGEIGEPVYDSKEK